MGVIKDRHGTHYASKAVPEKPKGLQAAVARELNNGKTVQKNLRRSLGTKDIREANIRAKPVLADFDQIIAKAKARLAATTVPMVKRTSLNDTEIKRMAEWVYAKALAWDERVRFGGRDEMERLEAEHLRLKGTPLGPWAVPYEQWPQRGVPRSVFEENRAELVDTLREIRQAAAMGDLSVVQDHVLEAMWAFNIELDEHSAAYIKLSTACLHSYLRALEAIEKRDAGITVETPAIALPGAAAITEGGTLQDALDGWKRHRARPKRTVDEFSRSVKMFIQLHGNMAVAAIKKKHALDYRKALQDVPRHRTGDLLRAPLPTQAEWGREHPGELRITAATINKQLGGVQSICIWASDNGLVPDDVQWIDPFSKLRLPEERSERTSFEVAELQLLFNAAVFTEHQFPLGAHGNAGYWMPVLALFTGARQAELGGLTAANVQTDAETSVPLLYFVTERARGKRVKTDASERVVPVHLEVIRLGFLNYVEERRKADGADAWIFPSVSPDKGRAGVPAFSQWFGRYLRAAGVTDKAKVFHSFRHTVKDALRRGRADHEMREALIGHAQASSVSWGYGANAMLSRFGAAALSDAVNSISYPGLDLSRVKPLDVPMRTRGDTKAT
ncbi:site-specific integrase [Bradyrhizobium sp. 197]|uniref:site-specific integrase n=1 Tax=Bradyrhizobium sp. 197 TaxID=2782663 RepID=UPI001FFB1C7D|nr:site-specific integrase [Bradyrhizobium sp. 197]MCK1477399.1 site-specific integrase [Bradyrhizobium sp. 197]